MRALTPVPLLLALALSCVAQPPQFDVASVKLVKGPVAPHGVSLLINHGKLNMDAAVGMALYKNLLH